METVKITVDLGIPMGSKTCERCQFDAVSHSCFAFNDQRENTEDGEWIRSASCLAAEQRFTPEPPTEKGYYHARHVTDWWGIVWLGYNGRVHTIGRGTHYEEDFDLWSGPIPMPGGGE